MERPSYVLESIESDAWRLVGPLTLWTFCNASGYTVGDYVVQMIGMGDTFDSAVADYCRNLLTLADDIDKRHERMSELLERTGNDELAKPTE